MSFFNTFNQMLVVLFAIAAGVLCNKLGYFNEDTNRRLSKVVLNITLPSMILASVMTGNALPGIGTLLSMFKMIAVFYLMEAVFVLAVPRFLGGDARRKGVWRYALLFPNLAFIGYPVIETLLGAEAIFYGVMLNLPFNLMSYSLGPLMLGGSRRFHWKSLCTPCLISSVISLGIVLSRLRFPALLGSMLQLVGDATVPLSLLVLGSILAGMSVGQVLRMPSIWMLSLFRLLVMPVALLWLLRPMGLEPMVLGVAVIEMGMPVAVAGSMLCMEYDGDVECMAQATFVTTMLSMVTTPLIAMLL